MSARILAGIALAAAALLTLSACGPTAHPTSSHSPHHNGSGSSPTPSATPVLAPPQVRIPLTCDQLAPAATLSSVLGTTMTPTNPSPDPSLLSYAAIQDGALNCHWTGPVVGGNATAYWDIYVMPDAAATWNTYKDQLQEPFPAAYLGAAMFGYCNGSSSGDNSTACNLTTLSGSVWLDVSGYTSAGTAPTSTSAAMAKYKPLLAAAINAVKGITVTEPAWTDPAATAVHFSSPYGVVNQDTFAAAIHAPFAIEVSQPQFDLAGAQIAEMLPVNYRQDGGGGTGAGDTVTPAKNFGGILEVLPSGSWAYPQMMAAASGKAGFTQLTGFGSKAYLYDGPGNAGDKSEVIIVGVVGEHLYSVDFGSPGTPGTPNLNTMAKAAATYIVGELTP